MAQLVTGNPWISGNQVTPVGLNQMVNAATISGIVNAEIAPNAGIQMSKLAAGALPAGITVASANIVDNTIVNADINTNAAIAHGKLALVSAGQILVGDTSQRLTARTMTGDATLANNGVITIANSAVTTAKIASGAVDATALGAGAVTNDKVSSDSGSRIAGSKIDPQFVVASTITVNSASDPALRITQTGAANALVVFDEAADTTPFVIGPTGRVGMGIATPGAALHVDTPDQTAAIIERKDDGATTGPFLELRRSSASPAASDVIGAISYSGNNSSGGVVSYAQIFSFITSATAGSEAGDLIFSTRTGGSTAEKLRVTGAGDILIDDKIVHRGDTDTAIRFVSNDNVSVETGGTQRLLVNANGTLASDTGGSIFLRPSDGALEIFRAAGSPYIDFKDDASDDFDCRIVQINDGLWLETGGNGSTDVRVDIKSTGQVRFVPLAADPAGAEAGDVYYNSGDNKLKVYNGSSWVDLH